MKRIMCFSIVALIVAVSCMGNTIAMSKIWDAQVTFDNYEDYSRYDFVRSKDFSRAVPYESFRTMGEFNSYSVTKLDGNVTTCCKVTDANGYEIEVNVGYCDYEKALNAVKSYDQYTEVPKDKTDMREHSGKADFMLFSENAIIIYSYYLTGELSDISIYTRNVVFSLPAQGTFYSNTVNVVDYYTDYPTEGDNTFLMKLLNSKSALSVAEELDITASEALEKRNKSVFLYQKIIPITGCTMGIVTVTTLITVAALLLRRRKRARVAESLTAESE